MNMTEYIYPELLFLIPFLNFFGWWMKHKTELPNKYIPLILGITSIVLCICYIASAFDMELQKTLCSGVVQGIFMASTAVYANQITKTTKGDE